MLLRAFPAVSLLELASAHAVLSYVIFEGSLLLCIRSLAVHYDRLDEGLEVYTPELRAFFLSFLEFYVLCDADYLDIIPSIP